MRFVADGPSIPDDLLHQRDNGNVVFFCGAGLSIPAGMPSFRDLAQKVLISLGTLESAESSILFKQAVADPVNGPAFDRIFNSLVGEYGVAEIEHRIANQLALVSNATLKNHKTVLQLSRNAGGQP